MKTLSNRRLIKLGRVSRKTRAVTPFITEELMNPGFGWPF